MLLTEFGAMQWALLKYFETDVVSAHWWVMEKGNIAFIYYPKKKAVDIV